MTKCIQNNELTVVMAFLNERDEVVNTVKSIRDTAGDEISIIVINDGSEKDFDYEGLLRKFNVEYIENPTRIGAAMSKQKGIDLVKTPYFLLLDAHMRFYDNQWPGTITSRLSQDPNRILCMQTLALHKDDNGEITTSNTHDHVFGAYIKFVPDNYVPGISWSSYKSYSPTKTELPIACILGAGYASSTYYWHKIGGMLGLIHYGCEEQFLSLKAWREGGGCFLLTNVRIGHIYRDKFPYRVMTSDMTANYLMIAETLFPLSDICYAHAVAWKQDKATYAEALRILQNRWEEIDKMRYEFSQWSGKSYKEIKRINLEIYNIHSPDPTIDVAKSLKWFEGLLASDNIPKSGLDGGMALSLLLGLSFIKQSETPDKANPKLLSLWEQFEHRLINEPLPTCFKNGAAGIGWMLLYANSHQLIEDRLDEELDTIDRTINQLAVERVIDYGFDTGLGGIYLYVIYRKAYNQKYGLQDKWGKSFIESLDSCARKVFDHTDDWRTVNAVLKFIRTKHTPHADMLPYVFEVSEIAHQLPDNDTYWRHRLSDVSGLIIKQLNE